MTTINCPTCGAKTNSVVSNCEYCGIEIKRAAESQITAQEMLNALTKRISDCPGIGSFKSRNQAEAIANFVLPSDIGLLAEFLVFCHGHAPTDAFNKYMSGQFMTKEAWQAKARSAYERLRLASLNNPQLSSYLAPFDKIYGMHSGGGLLSGLGKLFGR